MSFHGLEITSIRFQLDYPTKYPKVGFVPDVEQIDFLHEFLSMAPWRTQNVKRETSVGAILASSLWIVKYAARLGQIEACLSPKNMWSLAEDIANYIRADQQLFESIKPV